MPKKILIDSSNTIETRIAVTDNGNLDDFEIESNKKNAVKGDVYLAKITRVEPSLQAAFVDFGTSRNGNDYMRMYVEDETGSMKVMIFSKKFAGPLAQRRVRSS